MVGCSNRTMDLNGESEKELIICPLSMFLNGCAKVPDFNATRNLWAALKIQVWKQATQFLIVLSFVCCLSSGTFVIITTQNVIFMPLPEIGLNLKKDIIFNINTERCKCSPALVSVCVRNHTQHVCFFIFMCSSLICKIIVTSGVSLASHAWLRETTEDLAVILLLSVKSAF